MTNPITDIIVGISPLGNNSVEATADGHIAVDDDTPREVSLVYDPITGLMVAELSKENQQNRETSLEAARKSEEDQQFLSNCGFTKS